VFNSKDAAIGATIPANITAFTAAAIEAGYPKPGDPSIVKLNSVVPTTTQAWTIVGILTILVLYVTAVYGPIAAALVEFFPTRIRYTAMSLPYHIGNGWFGGFLPTTAFAIVAATGNVYAGLWYPVVVAMATVVLGVLLVRERKDVDLSA
jgi:hypothetical protein